MKTIYKYTLQVTDFQQISMPANSKMLSVQLQNGELVLWALIDKKNPSRFYIVEIFGTGHEVDTTRDYVGTVQYPMGLVWHVFI